jgi:hypothetical protein
MIQSLYCQKTTEERTINNNKLTMLIKFEQLKLLFFLQFYLYQI